MWQHPKVFPGNPPGGVIHFFIQFHWFYLDAALSDTIYLDRGAYRSMSKQWIDTPIEDYGSHVRFVETK